MPKLLVATHNAGKKREIAAILQPLGYDVVMFDDLSQTYDEPKETGSTYEENALIKAKAAGDASGLLTLADDSGLEVDALPGELSVFSARYANTETERNEKLLKAMEGKTNRNAKFVSCVVLYDPSTQTHNTFIGEVEGDLATEARGENGFGYDPLFIPKGFLQTFGEMESAQKNELSHRVKALQQLQDFLKK